MSRKINRSPAALRKHNEKWKHRYKHRANLRRLFPAEFVRLREEAGGSYHTALRLLEEAHPEVFRPDPPAPTPAQRLRSQLRCRLCGDPLRDHNLTGGCPE